MSRLRDRRRPRPEAPFLLGMSFAGGIVARRCTSMLRRDENMTGL